MYQIGLIALAGATGAVARWALSGLAYRLLGQGFAYGTLVVNVVGCLALGLLMELALGSDLIGPGARVALSVGFLGAFTTFSTFGLETVQYLQEGSWAAASLNVGSNVVLGLGATWGGLVLGRLVLGGS